MVVYNQIQFFPIPDYDGYYISKCGTVLSTRPKNGKGPCKIEYAKILKARVSHDGYKYIAPRKNNKTETKKVHRLMAMTFLKDFNVPGLTVDHKDNDKLNNNLDNLKMATKSEQERNKKSAAGIRREFNKRHNLWYWRAYWHDDEGKKINKSFSVNIYGELFAYLLAGELRQAMVDKYYNRP
jgi:hypothetical protein